MYLSGFDHRNRFRDILQNWPSKAVQIIVVSTFCQSFATNVWCLSGQSAERKVMFVVVHEAILRVVLIQLTEVASWDWVISAQMG
jgi:hypothetical protein